MSSRDVHETRRRTARANGVYEDRRDIVRRATDNMSPSSPPPDGPLAETRSASAFDAAEGGREGPRRRVVETVLVLLVIWAGWVLLFEAHGARHDWLAGQLHQPTSAYWRLGSRPPERLRRCLSAMHTVLPAREPLLLWDPAQDFYRWRWAAYFVPQRDVVQAGAATAPGSLVVASARTAPPGAERMRGDRWCALYRLP